MRCRGGRRQRSASLTGGEHRGKIATHQYDWALALTLDGFDAVPPSPRVHALCTGGVEPHGSDLGRSAGILDCPDQVHDMSTASGLWDDEHAS
jgi:hypothetical protein